jgi:hypothetical protein
MLSFILSLFGICIDVANIGFPSSDIEMGTPDAKNATMVDMAFEVVVESNISTKEELVESETLTSKTLAVVKIQRKIRSYHSTRKIVDRYRKFRCPTRQMANSLS